MRKALSQAQLWFQDHGPKYRQMTKNVQNFLGSDRAGAFPFPWNPAFRPVPPLSNEVKDTLAVKAESVPIRQLAIKNKISLLRLEAIVKLKAREAKMLKEGKVLQMNYASGMEEMLGVPARSSKIVEPLEETVPSVKSPRFAIIPEEARMTSEQAAELLGRRPPKDLTKKPSPVKEKTERKEKPLILQRAPEVQEKPSRWAFTFTDTGRRVPDQMAVLTRETNGMLRGATRKEVQERRRRFHRY